MFPNNTFNKNQPRQLGYTQIMPVSVIATMPITTINTETATNTKTMPTMNSVVVPTLPSTPINRTPQTKFQTNEKRANNRRTNSANKKTTATPRTPAVAVEGRRSSSRSIKRKRFDDEIVEYSVNYPQMREPHRVGRPRGTSHSSTTPNSSATSAATPASVSATQMSQTGTVTTISNTTAGTKVSQKPQPTKHQLPQQLQPKLQHLQDNKPVFTTTENSPHANKNIFVNKIVESTPNPRQMSSTPIIAPGLTTNILPTSTPLATVMMVPKKETLTPPTTMTTDPTKPIISTSTLLKPPSTISSINNDGVTAANTNNETVVVPVVTTTFTPTLMPAKASLPPPPPTTTGTTTTTTTTTGIDVPPTSTALLATNNNKLTTRPMAAGTTAITPRTPAALGGRKNYSRTRQTTDRRRTPRGTRRRKNPSSRPLSQAATRDLGRWKPIDDLGLILAIQQTKDLRVVHRSSKFSCRFTLPEIQARWHSMLFEPAISRTAIAAMRNLHPEMVESVERQALFSVREEELLSYVKSTENPKLEQFEELLRKNAAEFHSQRTAKTLLEHWQMMQQYQLLCDQMPRPQQYNDVPISFSEMEDRMLDTDLHDVRDETLEIELELNSRSEKRHARIIDSELARWNVLIDSTSNTNNTPEFDSQTLAVLRGRMVRYLMRSKEITFGRDARDQNIDIDLSLEGPATQISRRQGTIKLRSNGDFFISNEGKRPIFINGIPLAQENKTRLANNFVVEVCGLRLVFITNYELINAIRHESAKTVAALN